MSFNSTVRRVLRNDQLIQLVLALVVGAAAAYAAIGFRELYQAMQFVSFGTFSEILHGDVAALPPWRVVLAPTLGGLIVGLFVYFAMPGRRPHGVPDVMESAALRSGRMSLRAGLGAAFVSAMSIGAGASVGREGPVVHLGAAIGSVLSERLGFTRSQAVTLLGCGVASAVAASFNAPIAGAFFALEVVIGHYGMSAFGPIVMAAVVGTIVSRTQYGDFPAFVLPEHTPVSFLEFPAFIILGVVCAVTAILFIRSVAIAEDAVHRIPVPAWSRPMIAGLLIGLIALAFPEVLGVGYGTTDAALKGELTLYLLIALVVVKMAATAICLGSGFGGGVFSPSLFLGAMVGGAFGVIATEVFPDLSSGPGAYTLVGMGAMAGAVLGAPRSTILIVFEITGDYTLTIAVMVAVVIASVIAQQAGVSSFFLQQLDRRRINLRGGREVGLLRGMSVRDVMRYEFRTVPLSLGMAGVREELQKAPYGELFVVNGEGALHGTITLSDLSETAFDPSLDSLLNASDVARLHPPVLQRDDDLSQATTLMETAGEEHIGVVDNHQSMRLVGFVHQVDVMLAYNRALVQARHEETDEL